MARILIAVPTFENITPDTFKAIYDMDNGEHDVLFEFVRGHDCATARNKIAKLAQNLQADYLMMVDGDVTPKPDALLNMLSHGVDVVSGFYMHRCSDTNATTERTCVCKLVDDSGKPYFYYPLESEWTAAELRDLREAGENLVQIHGGGMGCVLINTQVFDQLPYPWFDWVNYPGNIGMLSEDLYFCEQLRNEGIPIYVDTRCSCGHLMRRIEYVE